MKKAYLFLLVGLLGISLSACARPPEQCREEISTSTEAGASAWNVVQKLQTEGLVRFDFPHPLSAAETAQTGLLLAAQAEGDKASDRQIDAVFLEAEARKIHALTTADKRFFFSYHTTEHNGFHVLQLSIAWRVGEQTSNTQKFEVTKTGYFNDKGELVCFWTHTPRV